MITTISSSENDYEETISTLRYANRAKNIKNHTHVNEQTKETLLLSFQTEIEELRKQLEIANLSAETELDADTSTPKKKDRASKSSKKKKAVSSPPFGPSTSTDPDVIANISEQDEELSKTKIEQEKIAQKLQQMTNKIIVGGVNLIEKAENQEFLLGITASQLDQAEQTEQTLKVALMQREAERINIEERYSSLQEEVNGKTKKIKKLASMIAELKAEQADLEQENQREMEGLLDGVRGLTRELQLAELIINSYIPPEDQELIEKYITWNEDIGEYHLKCVAYTGNNMRKRAPEAAAAPVEIKTPQCPYPYKQYSIKKKKTTNVPRPASRK